LTTPRPRGSGRWRPLTEGAAILLPLGVIGVVSIFLVPPVGIAAFVAAGLVWYAFRDPERVVQADPAVALSPADGTVLRVGPVFDDYWQTEMVEVAIFLALWNVHVQRFPLAGTVLGLRRKAGGYRPAMTEAATHGNNQLATYLETSAGPCTVTQISGLVARRIVTWAEAGDRVEQGQRLGMIKFGSQVTLRLPVGATVLVAAGERVEAGTTVIALLGGGSGA
jgi:phosphatidylserine decarboxylase